jgi:hypothetical protein
MTDVDAAAAAACRADRGYPRSASVVTTAS